MWLERYVIVVTSLSRDFLPSSWSMYHGTFWDYATLYGSMGLFLSLLFLFIRFLPVISMAEMRELVNEAQERSPRGHVTEGRKPMSTPAAGANRIYGIMAAFDSPEEVLGAARSSYEQGYRMMEAYTPFPVEGLAEALGCEQQPGSGSGVYRRFNRRTLGFFMQWFSAVVNYPINVGGRPLNSWPAFIPITFEMTVLGAALSAVVGVLAMNGLPRPHHPVFGVPEFALASNDRFFLSIQAHDPLFDLDATYRMLSDFHPKAISIVPF